MDGKGSGLELTATEPSTCSPPHEQTYIIEGKRACAPASKAMTSDTGSEQVCIFVIHCKSALPVVTNTYALLSDRPFESIGVRSFNTSGQGARIAQFES